LSVTFVTDNGEELLLALLRLKNIAGGSVKWLYLQGAISPEARKGGACFFHALF
jgi:hypothetical protein